jgi:hypothetical protein
MLVMYTMYHRQNPFKLIYIHQLFVIFEVQRSSGCCDVHTLSFLDTVLLIVDTKDGL